MGGGVGVGVLVGCGVTVITTNVGCTLFGASVGFGDAVKLPLPQPIMNKTAVASERLVSAPKFLTKVILDNNDGICESSDLIDRDVNNIAG